MGKLSFTLFFFVNFFNLFYIISNDALLYPVKEDFLLSNYENGRFLVDFDFSNPATLYDNFEGVPYQEDSISPKDILKWTNEYLGRHNESLVGIKELDNMITKNNDYINLHKDEPYQNESSTMDDATFMDETLRSIQYASLSYCPEECLKAWSCGRAVEGPTAESTYVSSFMSEITKLFGYIAVQHRRKTIIVSFRGSVNLKNWLNNFKFWMKKLPWKGASEDTKVHHGFYIGYLDIQQHIHTALSELLLTYPYYNLDVVGHSLGGALAVLAGLDLKAHLLPSLDKMNTYVKVVTVGQPRVGNEEFARYYNSFFPNPRDTLRIVNYSDLVPHIPPYGIGYTHLVQELWILEDNQHVKRCSAYVGEDPSCSSSLSFTTLSQARHLYALNVTFNIEC